MALFEQKTAQQKAAETRKKNEEERSARAKKASAAVTPEQRSKAAKKAAKTRAENKEAEEKSTSNAVSDTLDVDTPGPSPTIESPALGANDRRADDQAVIGHFVTVDKGKHKDRYGVALEVAEYEKDGEPKTVVVRARDEASDRFVVPYKDLSPAPPGRY